jgi:hypothetical protein
MAEHQHSRNVPETLSPLFLCISVNHQDYFSDHYFHREYVRNSPHGGKYRRHDNFRRLLKSIETYSTYIDRQDIIELTWNGVKSGPTQDLSVWQPLFKASGYHDIVLINATAQIALSHHLDDVVNKQISVAANVTVARQATALPAGKPSTSSEMFLAQAHINVEFERRMGLCTKTHSFPQSFVQAMILHKKSLSP